MATLPSYVRILFDGYSQSRESALMRTEFETGPPRQARIKTRVLTTRKAKLYLSSKANYLAFIEWFSTDLKEGALFFTMADPVTGANIEARFVGGGIDSAPMIQSLDAWEISISIESWGA